MLSEDVRLKILELQKRYPEKRSALIPALHMAQNEAGYLPKEIQEEIACLFEIDLNEVNSIVTFYDMFFDHPVGRRLVHVCRGIACMLNGADELAGRLCEKLQVKPGETTQNGEFTIHLSECLGACDKAPMAIIDHEVAGPIHQDDLNAFLKGKDSHG